MKIAAIGECMIELSAGPNSSMALRYGGDTLNTAVYLARLSANSGRKDASGDSRVGSILPAGAPSSRTRRPALS